MPRCLLFNELYFLVDGGTVWTDSTAGLPNPDPAGPEGQGAAAPALEAPGCAAAGPGTSGGEQKAVGQFLYLEGHEYLM